jgi:ABC-2 type transport system permease protein
VIPASSLLFPRLRTVANRASRLDGGGWGKLIAATLFIVGVWVGLYAGLVYLLRILLGVELLGPYLVDRLLMLLLLSFSGVLLLSNVVTSLAIYYMSDELMLINAAPVSRLRLFYARLVESAAASSWMVVVFGVPVIGAYGVVHGAPPSFYGLALLVGAAFLMIPASVGVVVTTGLVNVFPARAARDLLIILTALFLGGAWFVFRVLRPERLVNPEAFDGVAQFLSTLVIPQAGWLPSTWAARALSAAMRGNLPQALSSTGFLALWGAAFVVLAAWLTSALYLGGWSRAQEGRPARLKGLSGTSLQRAASRLLGRAGGAVLAKDVKVLARDATQWSQLVLLMALVAIYLFSIYALPFDALNVDTTMYRNAVAFLNIGMTGFVQAAVAARFVYPSVSTEGRGIWILRTAPTTGRELVRAKWLAGALPVLVFGEILAIASNRILDTAPLVQVLAVVDAAVLAFAICALASGLGAMMPDFKAENSVKVAASFGGLVYMAGAVTLLFAVVLLQAFPIYRVLSSLAYHWRMSTWSWLATVGLVAGSLLLAGVVATVALRQGARALEAREY